MKYLFFIGNDGKPDNHRKLDKEFEEYGDIVEEDFQENYYNLTLKTIGQLKWATHYCPNMKYGLHIDDDVFGQAKGNPYLNQGSSDCNRTRTNNKLWSKSRTTLPQKLLVDRSPILLKGSHSSTIKNPRKGQ